MARHGSSTLHPEISAAPRPNLYRFGDGTAMVPERFGEELGLSSDEPIPLMCRILFGLIAAAGITGLIVIGIVIVQHFVG